MAKVPFTTKEERDGRARVQAVEALEARVDRELHDSMWSQLPDAPISGAKQTEWREYRRQLREAKGEARGKTRADEVATVELPERPNAK